MTRRARTWAAGLLIGAVAVAAVSVAARRVPGSSQEAAREEVQAREVDSLLREAALARFKTGKVGLRMGDGTWLYPSDSEHETHIKVNLFKKLLAQEKMKKDPTFRTAAEQSLSQKRPAEIILSWEEPTGSQQVRFVSAATVDCALPMQPEFQVETSALSRHPCLQRNSLKSRWAGERQVLTVEVLPLDSGSKDWPRLLDDEMKGLAALEFLREQGHGLAASPSPGRME